MMSKEISSFPIAVRFMIGDDYFFPLIENSSIKRATRDTPISYYLKTIRVNSTVFDEFRTFCAQFLNMLTIFSNFTAIFVLQRL